MNIADRGDVIALPRQLSLRFGPGRLVDEQVASGPRMHDLARYLTAPKTGAAFAAGLPRGVPQGRALRAQSQL